jgi:hypothetical protein
MGTRPYGNDEREAGVGPPKANSFVCMQVPCHVYMFQSLYVSSGLRHEYTSI